MRSSMAGWPLRGHWPLPDHGQQRYHRVGDLCAIGTGAFPIDGPNHTYEAAFDGVLMLRRLFGFGGLALTVNATGRTLAH